MMPRRSGSNWTGLCEKEKDSLFTLIITSLGEEDSRDREMKKERNSKRERERLDQHQERGDQKTSLDEEEGEDEEDSEVHLFFPFLSFFHLSTRENFEEDDVREEERRTLIWFLRFFVSLPSSLLKSNKTSKLKKVKRKRVEQEKNPDFTLAISFFSKEIFSRWILP